MKDIKIRKNLFYKLMMGHTFEEAKESIILYEKGLIDRPYKELNAFQEFLSYVFLYIENWEEKNQNEYLIIKFESCRAIMDWEVNFEKYWNNLNDLSKNQ